MKKWICALIIAVCVCITAVAAVIIVGRKDDDNVKNEPADTVSSDTMETIHQRIGNDLAFTEKRHRRRKTSTWF